MGKQGEAASVAWDASTGYYVLIAPFALATPMGRPSGIARCAAAASTTEINTLAKNALGFPLKNFRDKKSRPSQRNRRREREP